MLMKTQLEASSRTQSLVNMGEILKAAGCSYDNGERNVTE